MSLLDPLSHALAILVAAAHAGLTSLGADADSGTTWVLCLALVVLAVRLALLPLLVHLPIWRPRLGVRRRSPGRRDASEPSASAILAESRQVVRCRDGVPPVV